MAKIAHKNGRFCPKFSYLSDFALSGLMAFLAAALNDLENLAVTVKPASTLGAFARHIGGCNDSVIGK